MSILVSNIYMDTLRFFLELLPSDHKNSTKVLTMTPSKIFYKINHDRFYLLKNYLLDTAVVLLLICLLIKLNLTLQLQINFFIIVTIVVLSIVNGLIVSSLLHNTSHANVPGKFLNRLLGEYCGYWALYGHTNFLMVHILHHQYSDEEMDPVSPRGMSFSIFVSAPMRYMIKRTKKYLFSVHGHHEDYKWILQTQTVIFHLNLILKIAFWYVLLGKFLFFTFYIPGFMSLVGIFAHINYVCHRDKMDGSIEIVNLDHNLYYKVANFITSGGYYHKNHHINMKLFNPKYLANERSKKPLISIGPKTYLNADEQYYVTGSFLSIYFNLNDVWVHGERNRVLAPRKFKGHSTDWS